MAVAEDCIPVLGTEPAVLSISRHGDLPFVDGLLQAVRDGEDISPTAFTYSVHNRLSSVVSMNAGYHGINGASSAVSDGFALTLAEATAIIGSGEADRVLVLAYEPEIPPQYHAIISQPWTAHAAAFVIASARVGDPNFRLAMDPVPGSGRLPGAGEHPGTCLPFLRAMLTNREQADGRWRYGPTR